MGSLASGTAVSGGLLTGMRFPAALVLAIALAGGGAYAHAPATLDGPAEPPAFAGGTSLNNSVLKLALGAAACARSVGAVANERLLTVIDYSKASTEPRLWVLDLVRERVLFEELVAHGRGSGENYATRFSNADGSHQTSLGLFRTADTYVGSNGYSLRLDGLEPGVNDRARERAIVMHGAPYVSDFQLRAVGRLGRSHGCPALRPAIARTLIDTIKQGSLVFAYYPDKQWLRASRFLNGCS
jgi:L,D-transpeptidase catalytic domain